MTTDHFTYDVLIIGAGAAGLVAMHDLVKAGYTVCILEATERAGGRIFTRRNDSFSQPVEMGAEFVADNGPITLEILKEAGIEYNPVSGNLNTVQNSVWFEDEERNRHFGMVDKKIKELETDRSIRDFLSVFFPATEYEALNRNVELFAEGFSLADPSDASIMSLDDEWRSQDQKQYRIRGGYQELIDYLLKKSEISPSVVHFNSPVTRIEHSNEQVIVFTADNRRFLAKKVIVTASLGVLQSGSIQFVPAIPQYDKAFAEIGFGSVIKFLFEFNEPFWKEKADDAGFIFSDEFVPTWWTQHPEDNSLLTGWLGGPLARFASELPGDELYEAALGSLATIFSEDISSIRDRVIHHSILCWNNQPYTKGGYSYNKPGSDRAKAILQQPVTNTVFFAGEALYTGELQGTVEAALSSGREVASRIQLLM